MWKPDKIILVTQKTALEELVERQNTAEQARFYITHMGGNFEEYEAAHQAYHASLEILEHSLPQGVRHQTIERSFLSNFQFAGDEIVVALGRDGLFVNIAKYLRGQPLIGINPDPRRIDGVLLPFQISQASVVLSKVITGKFNSKSISMAQASLNNGQLLLAVNDLFIGQRTHTSARYRIRLSDAEENQSSSGVIVSTGVGSTGWFRSIITGAAALVSAKFSETKNVEPEHYGFDSTQKKLVFSVREPFISQVSGAGLVFGEIKENQELIITSQMPQNGVIFSDGIEADYLEFNSGSIVTIKVADQRVNMVVG